MPARRKLATSRSSWLAIIPTCLAKIGIDPRLERADGTSVLLQDLTRSFGATRALDGLSIEMAPGELVALLGPSGCGKTTALRIVAGFEAADTGSVLVDGKDISSVPASRRDMGMVFQSYSLFPEALTMGSWRTATGS